MERITQFESAFDKRDADPKKNYGVHGVELRMVLKGELGATQFVLFTNWHLPHITESHRKDMTLNKFCLFEPMPADIGYHSPKPIYDGQTKMDNCPYLNGAPCYYDGSTLRAGDIYKILLEKGSDGVWAELEEEYKHIFGELK